MALTLSKESMNKFLDELLIENESYKCKIWATIMPDYKTLMKYAARYRGAGGALSNIYCYIGLTNEKLNFVKLDTWDADKVREKFSILISDIKNIKIKKSIIPGRKIIKLKLNQDKIKISVMNNAIGTNIKTQKQNAEILISSLFEMK